MKRFVSYQEYAQVVFAALAFASHAEFYTFLTPIKSFTTSTLGSLGTFWNNVLFDKQPQILL